MSALKYKNKTNYKKYFKKRVNARFLSNIYYRKLFTKGKVFFMRMCPKCHKNFIHDGKTACSDCASKIVEPIAPINIPVDQPSSKKVSNIETGSWGKTSIWKDVGNKSNTYKSIFFCFQGKQFFNESRRQYIFTSTKPTPSHLHLEDVKEGDIIFHAADEGILAISIAAGSFFLSKRPIVDVLPGEDPNWVGRMVETRYTLLKTPIIHSYYKKEIIKLQGYAVGKHYPFNKNGTGNQGYLFNLNKDLAKFFMEEIIKVNPHLATSIFAQELL